MFGVGSASSWSDITSRPCSRDFKQIGETHLAVGPNKPNPFQYDGSHVIVMVPPSTCFTIAVARIGFLIARKMQIAYVVVRKSSPKGTLTQHSRFDDQVFEPECTANRAGKKKNGIISFPCDPL